MPNDVQTFQWLITMLLQCQLSSTLEYHARIQFLTQLTACQLYRWLPARFIQVNQAVSIIKKSIKHSNWIRKPLLHFTKIQYQKTTQIENIIVGSIKLSNNKWLSCFCRPVLKWLCHEKGMTSFENKITCSHWLFVMYSQIFLISYSKGFKSWHS